MRVMTWNIRTIFALGYSPVVADLMLVDQPW